MRTLFVLTLALITMVVFTTGCQPGGNQLTLARYSQIRGVAVVPSSPLVRSTSPNSDEFFAGAEVKITDPATGQTIAVTTTGTDGSFTVLVPEGGPYLITVYKGNVAIMHFIAEVDGGVQIDIGIIDANSTALALITLRTMEEVEEVEDKVDDEHGEDYEYDENLGAAVAELARDIRNAILNEIDINISAAIRDKVDALVQHILAHHNLSPNSDIPAAVSGWAINNGNPPGPPPWAGEGDEDEDPAEEIS
ncbi:MAG TPA: hypothetical protein VLH40_01035 [Atribacteraceae bacterium]|nr:hypothetical protein [Atribacteraceae bacterium]